MKKRESYEKPQIKRVSLRPSDSVLDFCRHLAGGGGGTPQACDIAGQPSFGYRST